MHKNASKSKALLPILFISIIISVTLRSVALLTVFDFRVNYYEDKTLISIANYIVGAVCVLFFAAIFPMRKAEKLVASFSTPATYVPTGILGSAIILMAFDALRSAEIKNISSIMALSKDIISLIEAILFVLGILAAIHFSLTALITDRTSAARAGLGLCAVGFFALYSIYLYFSPELPINSPNKIVDQMAYLFSALFFLYEIRISLGREKWGAYIGFGLIASLLSAYSSVPSLICYLAEGKLTSHSESEIALTLALFIFITSRLALALSLKKDSESKLIKKLKERAEEREACVAERKKEERDAFNSIMAKLYPKQTEETKPEEPEISEITSEEVEKSLSSLEAKTVLSENEENSAENSEEVSGSTLPPEDADTPAETDAESVIKETGVFDTPSDTEADSKILETEKITDISHNAEPDGKRAEEVVANAAPGETDSPIAEVNAPKKKRGRKKKVQQEDTALPENDANEHTKAGENGETDIGEPTEKPEESE